MDELKLYFIAFSVHKGAEWHASAGHIFAKDTASIQNALSKRYGETSLRFVEEIPIEEGKILYGERWHSI